MAFQPAVISASNGLLATPAAASNAPSAGNAGLFQSMLAGATGEAPSLPATPNAVARAAPPGGALALFLQTDDAQPVQTAPLDPNEAKPATVLPAAASAATPAESPAQNTGPSAKPQIIIAPAAAKNASAEVIPQTDGTVAPPSSAASVETQAVTEEPEEPAPAQQPAAIATTTTEQAIIFAPFLAAQAPSSQPTATPAKDATAPAEADATPQSGLFKKTVFSTPAKTEPSNGAIAKIAGETLATPQTQQPARADTSQIGAASPITGFDAPRPATDSISTPVARALHGAAAMQVAQHVAQRFDGKSANFEVRLDPAELGRVDVKITVDHDKRVTAAVSADSAQTLSDLRGAARDIERALTEAGLDLAQGGLSFDLNQRQANDEKFDAAPYSAAGADESDGAETVTIAARPFGMQRWNATGVDVWT